VLYFLCFFCSFQLENFRHFCSAHVHKLQRLIRVCNAISSAWQFIECHFVNTSIHSANKPIFNITPHLFNFSRNFKTFYLKKNRPILQKLKHISFRLDDREKTQLSTNTRASSIWCLKLLTIMIIMPWPILMTPLWQRHFNNAIPN